MKSFQLFKLYNLKSMKKEKLLLSFTIISILITITISLVIPQFIKGNERYIENNIRSINGGDLSVVIRDKGDEKLNKLLDDFRKRGLDIKTSYMTRTYFIKHNNKVISGIVEGDYGIGEDEIILQQGIANILGVTVGDYVTKENLGEGIKKYKVKEIEPMAMGVDRDTELSSYGKIQYDGSRSYKDYYRVIAVSGENGEALKEEFIKNIDAYRPISLDDKRDEMKGSIEFQTSMLSLLSTIGYILSGLSIITTIIMILLKRKKEIAIMRMLSIKSKALKNSMRIELVLWLLVPVVLGGILSFPIANILLRYIGIPINQLNGEILYIILKGILFNILIFLLLSNIALGIMSNIKAITVLRDDQKEFKKNVKKTIFRGVLLIPIILVIYSIYIGSFGSILTGAIIVGFIVLFIGIISVIIKILSSIKYSNSQIMYSFKSIKSNFFTFTMILISITVTLWFIMIGFTMEQNISRNLRETFNNALPYNYLALSEDESSLEKVLSEDKDVQGYNKIYSVDGKVLNEFPNSFFKVVSINNISKDNYNAKFNITRGENLYEGNEEGVIVTDDFLEKNRLQVGDILEIEVDGKAFSSKIKGSYKTAGINSMAIYMESSSNDGECTYEIRSSTDGFINKLTNSKIMRLDELSDIFTLQFKKIVGIFKILSLLSMISIILLNINVVNMSESLELKDKQIIKALGLGRGFILKSELIKIVFIVIVGTILSLGLYTLIMNAFFALMFKSSISIGVSTIIIVASLGVLVTLISFNGILRKSKLTDLSLIREE